MVLHVDYVRLSETSGKFGALGGASMEFDLNRGSSTGSLEKATVVKQSSDGALFLRLTPPLSQQFRIRLTVESISSDKIFFLCFNVGIQTAVNFPFSKKTFHVPGPTVVVLKDELYFFDGKMTHCIMGEIREKRQLNITVFRGAISFLFPVKVSTLKLHIGKQSELMVILSVNFSLSANPNHVMLTDTSSNSKL